MRRLLWIAVALGSAWCVEAYAESGEGAAGGAEPVAPAAPPMGAEGSPRVQAEALELIDRGVEQRKAGDDRAALELFRRAFELNGSGQALAQMALAEQALGRWLDAHQHLRLA